MDSSLDSNRNRLRSHDRLHHDLVFLFVDSTCLGYHARITETEAILRILNLHDKTTINLGDGRFYDTPLGVNLTDGGTHQRTQIFAHRAADLVASLHGFRFFAFEGFSEDGGMTNSSTLVILPSGNRWFNWASSSVNLPQM